MPRKPTTSYRLTSKLVADHVGASVMCLSAAGLGRTYPLHAKRPGPALNRRVEVPAGSSVIGAGGVVDPAPLLVMVRIDGAIEQRAGYQGECGAWAEGHDAIADRLESAFAEGDVLLVIDSPGGAAAGLQQAVERALKTKAERGRRVTVFADEMIGSAAMWWAAAIGDEIFLPPAGQVGSIGARGEHVDISGMLAKEGVKKTYFADPPDKIAFAPEFPLGPVGESRGNRDVKIAADAFRAAVCAGPIGQRNKLTPEGLIELGADMLTGEAAVSAGLADGVASFDDVVAYALRMTEREPTEEGGAEARVQTKTTGAKRAKGDGAMPKIRSEEEDEEAGRAIPTKCGKCAVENEADAKFCKGCGTSMATKPLEEDEPEDDPEKDPDHDGDEDEPEEDDKAKAAHPPPPERMKSAASFAEIFGLPASASLPAQKTAALDMRQVFDLCAKLTGHRTAAGILSELPKIASEAGEAAKLRTEKRDAQRKAACVERRDLAKRLVASGGWDRGRVYIDEVNDAGQRVGEPKLSPVVAEMKLGTLRNLVQDFERSAPSRNPFEADQDAAAKAAGDARLSGGKTKAQRIEAAMKHPSVIKLSQVPGNPHSLAAIAEQWVATQDQQAAQIGGSQ